MGPKRMKIWSRNYKKLFNLFLQLFITCRSAKDTNSLPLKRYQLDVFRNCTFKPHTSALATAFITLRSEEPDSKTRQLLKPEINENYV